MVKIIAAGSELKAIRTATRTQQKTGPKTGIMLPRPVINANGSVRPESNLNIKLRINMATYRKEV